MLFLAGATSERRPRRPAAAPGASPGRSGTVQMFV